MPATLSSTCQMPLPTKLSAPHGWFLRALPVCFLCSVIIFSKPVSTACIDERWVPNRTPLVLSRSKNASRLEFVLQVQAQNFLSVACCIGYVVMI